jgi:hypothetical protein
VTHSSHIYFKYHISVLKPRHNPSFPFCQRFFWHQRPSLFLPCCLFLYACSHPLPSLSLLIIDAPKSENDTNPLLLLHQHRHRRPTHSAPKSNLLPHRVISSWLTIVAAAVVAVIARAYICVVDDVSVAWVDSFADAAFSAYGHRVLYWAGVGY